MDWQKRVLFLGVVLCSTALMAGSIREERKLYFGAKSTQAEMTYKFFIEFSNSQKPTRDEVKAKIEDQLTHLFGTMATTERGSSNKKYPKAVPLGKHSIRLSTSENYATLKDGTQDVWQSKYGYKGIIAVDEMKDDGSFTVVLPYNPDTIYDASIVETDSQVGYPCTDEHYNSQGDFWYFWNPYQRGCKLKEGGSTIEASEGKDYAVIPAKLGRKANTVETYPEYDRLADENGEITIDILMGMDDTEMNPDPFSTRNVDVNAENFKKVASTLEKSPSLKFTAQEAWTPAETQAYLEKLSGGKVSFEGENMPYVKEFVKENKLAKIRVRLVFGPSGINEANKPFHYFYQNALQNSSIMIYDGHSGLGGHLDLLGIEAVRTQVDGVPFKIHFNKSRYQIFYFNSCSSYTYYNSQYFARKKSTSDKLGTANLEIVTNGLATLFDIMGTANLTLIRAVNSWSKGEKSFSYQELAKEMDSQNLLGINGDEDNQYKPKK